VLALESRGTQVLVAQTGPGEVDRTVLAERIGRVLAGAQPVSGVISLLALDESPAPEYPSVPGGLAATLGLVQALGDAGVGAPLWVLTRGAVTTGTDDPVTAPVQAMAWGLGRSAGLEHPDRWGGLIDVPAVWDERAAAQVCAVLAGCGEDQVAVRPAAIMGRRLVRAPLRHDPQPARNLGGAWVPGGTVLVTGGTGAIGGRVARWVAERDRSRLVLASRSGPAAAEAAGVAATVAGRGAGAEVIACDIADRAQLTGLLTRIAATGPPLAAVMHTAGSGQGTTVQDMTTAELAEMVAAKAAGAAHLDELTAELGLTGFVLFSSAAATWGSGGQAGYAAANAYLDALAADRRGRGLAGTSVAWGLWGGGGMGDGYGGDQVQRRGLRVMDPGLAVAALAQVLDSGETQVTVADVDWARFAPAFTIRRASPLIAGLPEVTQALDAGDGDSPATGPATGLDRRLAGLANAEQVRVILELVQTEAAAVLGLHSTETIRGARPFRELGFDSLTAVELRNRLKAAAGIPLPATLIFDYPTPAALADYLRAEIRHDEATAKDPVLTGLDQLESALADIAAGDSDTRAAITVRLQTILSSWMGAQDLAQTAAVTSRLSSATADEVLSFIDTEFGSS
jgi:short-subunit dehydrogenase/acyl carrier protein